MARVAFVLDQDFEDSEFTHPYEAVRAAGHDAVIVGKEAGIELQGKKATATATVDLAATEADPSSFDALVIPGGYSPDKLRLDPDVVAFTRHFFEATKPVAAICHAGQLLAEARVLEGRTVTSWPSVRLEMELSGADWVDREVVVDGNLITSRRPDDLPAFTEALLEKLK